MFLFFLWCRPGISGSPAELGVDNTNTWHVPVDSNDDAFPSLDDYFRNPLAVKGGFKGIPAFITFPGVKDKEWSKAHPGKTSCQMLMMAEHKWFAEAAARSPAGKKTATGAPERSAEYEALKAEWKERALEILFLYYPKVRECLCFLHYFYCCWFCFTTSRFLLASN